MTFHAHSHMHFIYWETELAAGYFYTDAIIGFLTQSVSQSSGAGCGCMRAKNKLYSTLPSATLPSWLISPGFKLMCVTNPASRPVSQCEVLTRDAFAQEAGARQLALWKRIYACIYNIKEYIWCLKSWLGGCITLFSVQLHNYFYTATIL